MLQNPLTSCEEEELVLNDRPAEAAADKIPLIWKILSSWEVCTSDTLVAEQVEGISVQCISTCFCRHVDCTGRRQLRRKIERRLADLEFRDGTRWNVHRRRTHCFIRDVEAINLDTSRASLTSAN